MSGHTPGPWSLIEGPLSVTVVGVNNETIFHESDKRIPCVLGDARLIAQSPRLLEALKALLLAADNLEIHAQCVDGLNNLEIASDEARAAIAKAKGE
jgi:hypothetical protein